MNKYFLSLALVSQFFFSSHVVAVNPFAKLTPKVEKCAHDWTEKVANTLSDDLQLVWLNFFALNTEETIQSLIKCAEYLEKQPDMLTLHEELANNIMEIINSYIQNIEKKMSLKENMTDKEKENVWQKLAIKVQELIAYINSIYYQTLYTSTAKRNKSLVYMFDENGIIPQEKRTRKLPQPI